MKKKIIALGLVIALATIAVVGMSLAYFTDTTETKENTFTVGKVDIELNEPKWDNNPVLMPGVYVDKDPTVTVADDSEDCYLFVEIDMARYMGFAQLIVEKNNKQIGQLTYEELRDGIDEFIIGIDHAEWEVMNATELQAALESTAGQNPVHLKLVLGYKGKDILKANDTVQVFSEIGLPAWVKQDMLGYKTLTDSNKTNPRIRITAYAIQAAGLDTLSDAYIALVGDIGPIGAMP